MIHRHFLATLIAVLALGQAAWAEDLQNPQTGTQYRVTGRQTYKVVVPDTHIEERPYTVYTDHVTTELHPTYRNIYTPVTEYSWEPYLANRWNPFSQPSVAYRYVPHTRWDVRTEESQVALTKHEMQPEQRVAQVPVTTSHIEDREVVTSVAVNNSSAPRTIASSGDPFSSTATASRPADAKPSSFVDRR
jgi:hypothetical protein